MLLVLYWMLMAACFFLTGFGALRTVSLSDSGSESTKGLPDTSIFTVIWLGAAVFTGLVQYLSLLGGIDRGMRLSVVCLLALYALIDRSAIRAFVSTKLSDSKRVLLPGFVVLIALLLFTITHASQGPHDYDMGLYHALAVNWVDEYGSVPGLGNLHSRLAFNFSLFPLAAFFDFWTFDQKVFHLICSFFFLLVGFYLLLSPFNWLLGDKRVFHLFNILVLIPLFDESSQHLASIQPNYISLLLSVFIISQVLQLMESEERLPAILYISAIVLYAVTIKLHMLPYLLIPIVCSALHWRELLAKRKVLFMSVMLLLIVLPWMIRGVLISGWLLYPIHHLDLFSFDWKIPAINLKSQVDWTTAWAFVSGTYPDEVLASGIFNLVQNWYARNSSHTLLIWLRYSFAASFIISVLFIKYYRRYMYYLLLLQSVMVLGLILWVTKAPDFRFGVSYLIPGIALFVTCAMLLPFKSISVPRLVGLIGVPVLAIGVAIELGGRIDWSQVLSSDYSGYREIETEEYTYPSGLTIRIPRQDRGDQCWAASLLCNPGHWVYRTLPGPDNIELRGESLSDGFRNLDQRVEKVDLKKLWQF